MYNVSLMFIFAWIMCRKNTFWTSLDVLWCLLLKLIHCAAKFLDNFAEILFMYDSK